MKAELIIPDLCGTVYDKYDTFKECMFSLDSRLIGNGN